MERSLSSAGGKGRWRMNLEYAQALSNFGPLVDPKVGLIRSVELVKVSESDPQVYLAHADPCDTTPLTGIRAANRGAACSTTRDRAILRACGESVERYCSAFFKLAELRLATAADLEQEGSRFVTVHEVYPFAAEQYSQDNFPYRRVDSETAVRCVRATSLMTDEVVWVPASCVYVPYTFDIEVEPFTHMPISTGLAAGPSVESCIRKGIFEILERDALMIVWYGRLSAPRISPESCKGVSPEVDALLSAAIEGGPRWHINLLTLDIDVPVISAALIDPGSPPLTSFGIAADQDPGRALMLALEEAVLTRLLLNRSSEIIDDPSYVHEHVKTLRDHLLAHATSPALRKHLRFLTDAEAEVDFSDLAKRELSNTKVSLKDRLAAVGFEVVWVEVTTPDIKEAGFRVVRSIIPGMQPLDNDHRYRYLGGSRLITVPPRLGHPKLEVHELNQEPHPFP
jgi:ribosomal protein S12 methylthiotransferase accessory factor